MSWVTNYIICVSGIEEYNREPQVAFDRIHAALGPQGGRVPVNLGGITGERAVGGPKRLEADVVVYALNHYGPERFRELVKDSLHALDWRGDVQVFVCDQEDDIWTLLLQYENMALGSGGKGGRGEGGLRRRE